MSVYTGFLTDCKFDRLHSICTDYLLFTCTCTRQYSGMPNRFLIVFVGMGIPLKFWYICIAQ